MTKFCFVVVMLLIVAGCGGGGDEDDPDRATTLPVSCSKVPETCK